MNSFRFDLLSIILTIPAVMIAFTAQGYGRAWVADKLGDKLPRFQGRLTMNPIAHLDPIGFLMILLIGFGWTKPVETNPRAFKRGYKDAVKVSIAAPLANLIVGFVATILYFFLMKFTSSIIPESIFYVLVGMIYKILVVNVGLAIFTLLPLPGLAGFDIFKDLFPKVFYKYGDKIYQYQFIILILVIFLGQVPLGWASSKIIGLFTTIASLIFGVF